MLSLRTIQRETISKIRALLFIIFDYFAIFYCFILFIYIKKKSHCEK